MCGFALVGLTGMAGFAGMFSGEIRGAAVSGLIGIIGGVWVAYRMHKKVKPATVAKGEQEK